MRARFWLAMICVALVSVVVNAEQEPLFDAPMPDSSDLAGDDSIVGDLLDMDLESLRRTRVAPALDVEVTSVARTAQPIRRTPAAVYVVTSEMIERTGAQNIPDVLRTVPGVSVARIRGSAWAISIRGANSEFANKLLVQIDGRDVYTPTFAGVFWDQERVMLKDVDRIEIIRGPGASVWGANAVNGVINIVTKSASETTGGYAEVGGGTELRDFSRARVGGQLGENAHYRFYGMHENTDEGFRDPSRGDNHRHAQAGARVDWTPTQCDTLTLQGDYLDGYSGPGRIGQSAGAPTIGDDLRRGNGLFRWVREVNDTTSWAFQSYYNHFHRHSAADMGQDMWDVDYQYNTLCGPRHAIVTGVNYRHNRTKMDFSDDGPVSFDPERQSFQRVGCFLQDTMTLIDDRVFFTVGAKLSHNDFSGFEYQPTAKVAWTPNERTSIWSSVSRAVRTPSLTDRDTTLTIPIGPGEVQRITGNKSFRSEEAITYELGMRQQPSERFYWDLATYFSRYDHLWTMGLESPFMEDGTLVYPRPTNNGGAADTFGVELSSTFQVNECWGLTGSYTFFVENPRITPPDEFFLVFDRNTPRNMVYLQSSMDLTCTTDLDLMFRYVDSFRGTPSYLVMDVHYAWEPRQGLVLSVVGRNLFDNHHPELMSSFARTEVEQEVFASVEWEF